VEAEFKAGQVSSDGGSLLLRETDRRINLLGRLAGCFTDGCSPLLVKHPLSEMLTQRIYGLALGYEDLNDHEQLRADPLLAVLSGKRELDEPLVRIHDSTVLGREIGPAMLMRDGCQGCIGGLNRRFVPVSERLGEDQYSARHQVRRQLRRHRVLR
jgi:hypothetical protein